MIATLLGKKIGMTQVYDAQNVLIPVTVVEAGPCPVVQVKTVETDGYNAVQLGFAKKKAEEHQQGRAQPRQEGRAWPTLPACWARSASRSRPPSSRVTSSRHGLPGGPARRCHRRLEGQGLPGRRQEAPCRGRPGGPRFDVPPPHRLDRHAPDPRPLVEEPVDARPPGLRSLHDAEPAGREGAAGEESSSS